MGLNKIVSLFCFTTSCSFSSKQELNPNYLCRLAEPWITYLLSVPPLSSLQYPPLPTPPFLLVLKCADVVWAFFLTPCFSPCYSYSWLLVTWISMQTLLWLRPLLSLFSLKQIPHHFYMSSFENLWWLMLLSESFLICLLTVSSPPGISIIKAEILFSKFPALHCYSSPRLLDHLSFSYSCLKSRGCSC